MPPKRKLYLDFLRVLAIFLVVYSHTKDNGCYYYYQIHESFWHLPLMVVAFLMNCHIPLFFMVSGALLLGRNEPLNDLFRKRVLRFLIILVLASFISYLYQIWPNVEQFSLPLFISRLFSHNWCESYWFLYTYLAWLICLPILRKLAQNMENKDFLYLLIVSVVIRLMTFIPIYWMKEPVSYNDSFSPFVLLDMVFFPLMGYYLEVRVPESGFCRKNTIVIMAAFVCASMITVATENYWCAAFCNWERENGGYFTALRFVPAFFLFYGSKLVFLRRTPAVFWRHVITILGECSFGLYLFQHIYLEIIPDRALIKVFGTYLGTLLWAVTACIFGTIITYTLKHIPGLKNFCSEKIQTI